MPAPRPAATSYVTGDLAFRGVAADAKSADDVFAVAVAGLVGVDAADVSVNVAPAARRRLADGVVLQYVVRTSEPDRVSALVTGLTPDVVDAAVGRAAADAGVADEFAAARTTAIGPPQTSTSAPPSSPPTTRPAAPPATPTREPSTAWTPTREPSASRSKKKKSGRLGLGAIVLIVACCAVFVACVCLGAIRGFVYSNREPDDARENRRTWDAVADDTETSDREHLARLESVYAAARVTPDGSPDRGAPATAPAEARPTDGLGEFPDFGL